MSEYKQKQIMLKNLFQLFFSAMKKFTFHREKLFTKTHIYGINVNFYY